MQGFDSTLGEKLCTKNKELYDALKLDFLPDKYLEQWFYLSGFRLYEKDWDDFHYWIVRVIQTYLSGKYHTATGLLLSDITKKMDKLEKNISEIIAIMEHDEIINSLVTASEYKETGKCSPYTYVSYEMFGNDKQKFKKINKLLEAPFELKSLCEIATNIQYLPNKHDANRRRLYSSFKPLLFELFLGWELITGKEPTISRDSAYIILTHAILKACGEYSGNEDNERHSLSVQAIKVKAMILNMPKESRYDSILSFKIRTD